MVAALIVLFSPSNALGPAPTVEAASVLFSDNFEGETKGLNKTALGKWFVRRDTVDVHGQGLADFYPTQGLYIDLSGNPGLGKLETKSSFSLAPGTYTLKFKLGNNGDFGTNNSVLVTLGTAFSKSYARQGHGPMTVVTETITVANAMVAPLIYDNTGPSPFTGIIIDDVELSSGGGPELKASTQGSIPAYRVPQGVGDSATYDGTGWDANGGSIVVSLEGKQIATFKAASTFRGTFSIPADQDCKTELKAVQGSTERTVSIEVPKVEQILATAGNLKMRGKSKSVPRSVGAGTVVCWGETIDARGGALIAKSFEDPKLQEHDNNFYTFYRAEAPNTQVNARSILATQIVLHHGSGTISAATGEAGVAAAAANIYQQAQNSAGIATMTQGLSDCKTMSRANQISTTSAKFEYRPIRGFVVVNGTANVIGPVVLEAALAIPSQEVAGLSIIAVADLNIGNGRILTMQRRSFETTPQLIAGGTMRLGTTISPCINITPP